jgi:uncharacterized protein (DUF4415 family)
MDMNEKNVVGAAKWGDPDEAPELDEEFFDRAEIRVGGRLIRRGRPPTGKAKRLVSLRIDQDVLQRLRGLGPGWQTRANDALRAFVERLEDE